ncbi:Ribose-phosphate pyrophosphokinase [Halomonadaceae bacterium LMG 33818]
MNVPLSYPFEKKLMLFSGRANPALAEAIADQLSTQLSDVCLKTFTSGEIYCRYDESIRGADVFIIQPMCANADTGVNPNDAFVELLLMIDAAVGASARSITAVTPWFGYCRQDKKSDAREPISARMVARTLETVGVNRVLTMDLHAGQLQGFFGVPVDHMTSLMMLADYFSQVEDNIVVVAPDAGRVKLNKQFATRIKAGLAILDKERPRQQEAEITQIIGDVRGKTAIIIDDIIDTAGTLCAAGDAVMAAGANKVLAGASHPVLSGNAIQRLEASPFERIVVTDSIPLPENAPSKIEVLSCASLLANTIGKIFTNHSVSAVFGGKNHLF